MRLFCNNSGWRGRKAGKQNFIVLFIFVYVILHLFWSWKNGLLVGRKYSYMYIIYIYINRYLVLSVYFLFYSSNLFFSVSFSITHCEKINIHGIRDKASRKKVVEKNNAVLRKIDLFARYFYDWFESYVFYLHSFVV